MLKHATRANARTRAETKQFEQEQSDSSPVHDLKK